MSAIWVVVVVEVYVVTACAELNVVSVVDILGRSDVVSEVIVDVDTVVVVVGRK